MQMYWPIALIVLSNIFYHISAKSIPAEIHPFASLTVSYLVAAVLSVILYFLLSKGGNLLQEYRQINWSSIVLGIALIGLEVGSIYMYKVGWNINTGQLVYSAILAVALLVVGYLRYHEPITATKLLGVVICMAGLYFINK